ncbi:MAG: amino acid--tRNA ligase-related protein, partial [Chloroflexota bacterium]
DRQPEFTQLDLEMSFVEEEDILGLLEELFTSMVAAVKPEMRLVKPFPRLSYAEAEARYGTDKPDLRFGMELADLSDIAARSDFAVFRDAVAKGGVVKGLCLPGCAGYSRHQLEELNQRARGLGAGGLVTMGLAADAGSIDGLTMEQVKSVASKFLSLEQVKEMAGRLNARAGDLLLMVAGPLKTVNPVLDELRREMGRRLGLVDPASLVFAFVTGFPLLDRDEATGRWESMHHPFTAPWVEDVPLLDTAPEKVRGRHYDMVCNGYEIAGGSIRIHIASLQRKLFRMLGYSDAEVEDRFGHFLEAFEYGAPPHGGAAFGIDRLLMILAGAETIREVIPFPKNQNAVDLTFGAPSPVSEAQLAELHLRLREE